MKKALSLVLLFLLLVSMYSGFAFYTPLEENIRESAYGDFLTTESFSEYDPAVTAASLGWAEDLQVAYHLVLEKDNCPTVEVEVKNASSSLTVFFFWTYASNLGALRDLKAVFKNITAETMEGKPLAWSWKSSNEVVVSNSNSRHFRVRYSVDAINLGREDVKFAIFNAKRVFFVAQDVFLLPEDKPSKITVRFTLPEGLVMFSSLPEENGTFIATNDLWGDLILDFQKAYFTGGNPIFNLTYYTAWGDKYIYIWFDRDPVFSGWLPSYGDTPWEEAEKYLKTTEMCAKYFREIAMGPLPPHTVIFTNTIPNGGTNTDWFHYMQIWPRYSEPEICHHIFHQYSFHASQSKLAFSMSAKTYFLAEGLPTYFEQVVPSLLLNDSRYQGKLFEFFVLHERGKRFGILENSFHIKYNLAALKVYLLDRYIKEKTKGTKTLTDFTKELWNIVKDSKKPLEVSDKEVTEALARIVGESNKQYILDLAAKDDFSREDFNDLLPYFKSYVEWMSKEYFWNNELLFLVFLDIVATRGGEWPHYATYPHNIQRYKTEALTPFKKYLLSLGKSNLTQKDIIDALNFATGTDHSDFFAFWESFGITLDPQSLSPLNQWDPGEKDEGEFLATPWFSVGTLKTEHYLGGILQQAEIDLDQPDDDGKIVVEVRLHSFYGYPPGNQAREALSGQNVHFLYTSTGKYSNVYITSAFFEVITDDPARRVFHFNLRLPSFSTHPKFLVYNPPFGSRGPLGELYWLHPIDPIDFEVRLTEGTIILPEIPLADTTYTLRTPGGDIIKCAPGQRVNLPANASSLEISLYDKFGFLRARKIIELTSKTTVEVVDGFGNLRNDWLVEVIGVAAGWGKITANLALGRQYVVRASGLNYVNTTVFIPNASETLVKVKIPTARLSVMVKDSHGKIRYDWPVEVEGVLVQQGGVRSVEVLAGRYKVKTVAYGREFEKQIEVSAGENATVVLEVPTAELCITVTDENRIPVNEEVLYLEITGPLSLSSVKPPLCTEVLAGTYTINASAFNKSISSTITLLPGETKNVTLIVTNTAGLYVLGHSIPYSLITFCVVALIALLVLWLLLKRYLHVLRA